jgi:Na+-transporting NADH:ubiquinone oxidoreductase subunit NqrA
MLGGCIEEEIRLIARSGNPKDGNRHHQTEKEKLYGNFQLQVSASKNNKKGESASKVKEQNNDSTLVLTVLPEQPLLQTATEFSESQTALMLFEGEK